MAELPISMACPVGDNRNHSLYLTEQIRTKSWLRYADGAFVVWEHGVEALNKLKIVLTKYHVNVANDTLVKPINL